MPPKVQEVLKRLKSEGWVLVNQVGSHRQFKHPSKSGRVTLHDKPSATLAPGTWQSIQTQAGWKKR